MSDVVDRLILFLLRAAAQRWPLQAREDLLREWTAELYALGHEATVPTAVRVWRQVRFGVSLAVRRPLGGLLAGGVLGAETAVVDAVMLFFAPLAAATLAELVLVPLSKVVPVHYHAGLAGVSYLTKAASAVLVGTLVARRVLRRRWMCPVGALGCAAAAVPVAAGTLIADAFTNIVSDATAGRRFAETGSLGLAVVLPLVGAGVAGLAGRGHRRVAVWLAGLSAPLVVLGVTFVGLSTVSRPSGHSAGPLWWMGYLWHGRPPKTGIGADTVDPYGTAGIVATLAGLLLTSVVLALAYTLRVATSVPARPAPAGLGMAFVPDRAAPAPPRRSMPSPVAPDVPAIARSPWWHRSALAGGAFAVMAWALSATFLTGKVGPSPCLAPCRGPGPGSCGRG